MPIEQGQIFEIGDSVWIVVDNFHNRLERFGKVHCAPLFSTPDICLELDVPIAFRNAFVSLSLMRKLSKSALNNMVAVAHPEEVEQIRRNLVTRFAYYSFMDLSEGAMSPTPPGEPPTIYPGMLLNYQRQLICVVDHWGCFNEYPLIYVAPVVAQLTDPDPLDIEISAQFRDLFNERYFVRTDDIFLVDRQELEEAQGSLQKTLAYGLVRKISRATALKFGQLGLLL